MSAELEHIWTRVQAELALAVDEPTYRIWLRPLRPLSLSDGRLLIEAPAHARGWIRDRFGQVLQASVVPVLGPEVLVDLVSTPDRGPDHPNAESPGAIDRSWHKGGREAGGGGGRRTGADRASRAARQLDTFAGLPGNPKLTFDQFVIGDCNRLAHAAALTVAEMPAQAYNPLFICGPPGVGKTHLLNSIASLLLSHSPGLTVRCTTGEAFTNEFLNALGDGHTDDFKARFRHVDVLLMDDIQFLERKTKTEEEFFHTFNALHDGSRQIVLTSDRPPNDLKALEDRLRERFVAGLVADIEPPGLATRVAILRKRAHYDNVEFVDDRALATIAARVDSNVRALEGALIRIVAFSSLTGRALTPELADEVLDRLYPRPLAPARPDPPSIAEIQLATCRHFGLSHDELVSPSRAPRVSWPRQVAMYLARELTSESLPAIGRCFAGRDHTTVLHACRRTTSRMATDPIARDAVDGVRNRLHTDDPSTGSRHA